MTGLDSRHAYDPVKGPPYGIYPSREANYQFVVRGKIPGQKVQRKYFVKEIEAKTYAHMMNTQAQAQGMESLAFPTWLRVMAQTCQERLSAHKKSIEDATRHYLEHLERCAKSLPMGELVKRCMATKKSAGVSKHYLYDLNYRLSHFAKYTGEQKSAAEVTSGEIQEYLMALAARMGPCSRNHVRRHLCTLFSYAKKGGFCAENPAEKTEAAKMVAPPVGIFTPDQAAGLLAHAPADLVPFLAIGLFAGIRIAELLRLDWCNVDLADGYIEVTAENAKSARRRLVKILPNLDAWIRPHAKQTGAVYPHGGFIPTTHIGYPALLAAGITNWPRNAMRHSFASYHIAHFKEAAALALEMGHTTTSLIFQHYRQVVRASGSERYWSIMPAGAGDAGKVINFAGGGKK